MAGKGEDNLKAIYIKVDSLVDLARCALGAGQGHIKAIRTSAGGYRLFCEGERIWSRIAYYFDSDTVSKYLIYKSDEQLGETAQLKGEILGPQENYASYKFPIVELAADPFTAGKKTDSKDVAVAEVMDYGSIVRALVNSMADDDVQPRIYSFTSGKHRIIGSFEMFRGHSKVFAYSKLITKESFTAFGYDYTTDTVERSSTIKAASKVYIRVINLAEPFPFFPAPAK